MLKLNLYTTSACHLCEEAEALLNVFHKEIKFSTIEISESDALIQAYGIRIPVLQRTDTLQELNWPFTQHDISKFVSP